MLYFLITRLLEHHLRDEQLPWQRKWTYSWPHQRLGTSRLRDPKFELLPEITLVTLPPMAIAVDEQSQVSSIYFPKIAQSQIPPAQPMQPVPPTTSQQHIETLSDWKRLLIQCATYNTGTHRTTHEPSGRITLGIGLWRESTSKFLWSIDCVPSSEHRTLDQVILEIGGYTYGLAPS